MSIHEDSAAWFGLGWFSAVFFTLGLVMLFD